jgi:hypothetical protein
VRPRRRRLKNKARRQPQRGLTRDPSLRSEVVKEILTGRFVILRLPLRLRSGQATPLSERSERKAEGGRRRISSGSAWGRSGTVVFVRKINDKPHLRFCPMPRILNYYYRKTSSAATIFEQRTGKLLESLGLRAKPALGSFAVLRRRCGRSEVRLPSMDVPVMQD